MPEYYLTAALLGLSYSTKWDEAKLEWEVIDIEKVKDAETCLCGHFPILEVCVIRNTKTHEKARVGNCCVKKFNNKSDKIFRAVAKILRDSEKSVNSETLNLAIKNGSINKKEYNFYMDILRKRKLSVKQTSWKKSINHKITDWVKRNKI